MPTAPPETVARHPVPADVVTRSGTNRLNHSTNLLSARRGGLTGRHPPRPRPRSLLDRRNLVLVNLVRHREIQARDGVGRRRLFLLPRPGLGRGRRGLSLGALTWRGRGRRDLGCRAAMKAERKIDRTRDRVLRHPGLPRTEAARTPRGPPQLAPDCLSSHRLSPHRLDPAQLTMAQLSPAKLTVAQLRLAKLCLAKLYLAQLTRGQLTPAQFTVARFSLTWLSLAQITGGRLAQTGFASTQFSAVRSTPAPGPEIGMRAFRST